MKKFFITQIYFTKNEMRNEELRKVIEFHRQSEFDMIYYLNEQIYDLECEKITEINFGKRLKYNDVFNFVHSAQLEGAIFFGNSDIYFNSTIHNLCNTFSTFPTMYCQLRTEHLSDGTLLLDETCNNYVRGWCHDIWIYHSKFNKKIRNSASFFFGIPNCDPCFAYIAKKKGFKLINHPHSIQCIHLHNVDFRTGGRNAAANNVASRKMALKYPQERVIPKDEVQQHLSCHS